MENLSERINDFINQKIWAVVGASPNPEKAGHQIYIDLKNAGYEVYPVHPKAKELFGSTVYKTLSDLPKVPDVVDLVVPPEVAFEVLREAYFLGVKRIWFQPGTESDKAINFCEKNGIQYIAYACVMKDMLKTR
jgi:hypothetical protein